MRGKDGCICAPEEFVDGRCANGVYEVQRELEEERNQEEGRHLGCMEMLLLLSHVLALVVLENYLTERDVQNTYDDVDAWQELGEKLLARTDLNTINTTTNNYEPSWKCL